MNAIQSISLGSLGLVLGAALGACGGEKQTPVEAPTAKATSPGVPNMQPKPPPPDSPTSSNVRISDEIKAACGISDADAYFGFDSAHVTGSDSATLDKVAVCFTKGPLAGRQMSLVGHADPRGSGDYNLTLGQSRADAVGVYLTAHGMPKPSVSTTSRGAMDATGTEDTSWAHDRRVDVLLK